VISFTLSPTYPITQYPLVKMQVGLKNAVATAVRSVGLKLIFVPVLRVRDGMDTQACIKKDKILCLTLR
jgi:hypothetical protein